MCGCVSVSVCLFASDHSLLTTLSIEQSRRARVCLCKKGKKIGFALTLFVIAHSSRTGWCLYECVCVWLGGNSKILFSLALTCYFLQQNSAIVLEISNTIFLFASFYAHYSLTPLRLLIHSFCFVDFLNFFQQ